MTYNHNVHTTPTAHDRGDIYTESGMRVPAAEVRAREVAEQAQRWLAFATERTRMRPDTLTAKALQSVAFSVGRRAASLAVPSKLTGTSDHQRALWALVRDPAEPWAALDVERTADGLLVSHDGTPLGLVQTKHLGWVTPLAPFGLTVHLSRVTGHAYEGYTLGANVCLGNAGRSLDRLLGALGPSGDPCGDGAPTGPAPAGDGRVGGPLRLVVPTPTAAPVVRPEHEALASQDPLDVVLYRSIAGAPHATCDHVVRHSPTGVGWGAAAGAAARADLALSVLTHVVGAGVAEDRYAGFAAEVVARVPPHGGVLLAARVRAWVADQGDR